VLDACVKGVKNLLGAPTPKLGWIDIPTTWTVAQVRDVADFVRRLQSFDKLPDVDMHFVIPGVFGSAEILAAQAELNGVIKVHNELRKPRAQVSAISEAWLPAARETPIGKLVVGDGDTGMRSRVASVLDNRMGRGVLQE